MRFFTAARRRGYRFALPLASLAMVGLLLSSCAGPAQPSTGLGAKGPCSKTSASFPDPNQSGQTMYVFEPGGSATPATGGRCDDSQRPLAVVVHGLGAGIGGPTFYQGIIDQLVSAGNVVIFATYNTDVTDFVGSFQHEDAAIVAASTHTTRADKSRVGIVGHSMGGGAIPFLVRQLPLRGWGTNATWAMSLAPWQIQGVPDGTIVFPSNAVVAIEAYSDDTLVQKSVGVDMYNRLSTPASRKQHITLRTTTHNGTTLKAEHTTPNSVLTPDDAMKFFGIYRVMDALQQCSLFQQSCDADLSYMGTWPDDGSPVLPAISTDSPTP